jgi:hypothetical protein
MANVTTGGFWKLTDAAVIATGIVHVTNLIWDSPSASADDIVIKDNGGNLIWEMKAIAGGTGITYERGINASCNGFNLDTIDSGTLYVQIG